MVFAPAQARDDLFNGPGLISSGDKFRNHFKLIHGMRLTRIFPSLQQKNHMGSHAQ
jgi:hypothetical protein